MVVIAGRGPASWQLRFQPPATFVFAKDHFFRFKSRLQSWRAWTVLRCNQQQKICVWYMLHHVVAVEASKSLINNGSKKKNARGIKVRSRNEKSKLNAHLATTVEAIRVLSCFGFVVERTHNCV